jgi:hypothetical protein
MASSTGDWWLDYLLWIATAFGMVTLAAGVGDKISVDAQGVPSTACSHAVVHVLKLHVIALEKVAD